MDYYIYAYVKTLCFVIELVNHLGKLFSFLALQIFQQNFVKKRIYF
jgi:hypothetical protein